MNGFIRGIENTEFIEALNGNNNFQQMIADDDLFIAVRKDSVHVYHYGQRIYEILFLQKKNKIKWRTHKKYLEIDEKGYVAIEDNLIDIESIKRKAKKYRRREKEQVKKYILNDNKLCTLDVEITFGQEGEAGRRSIDFLAVENGDDNKLKLIFYEAKLFKNPEVRSLGVPVVIEQLKKYENALNAHKHEILESYKTVLKNIKDLNLTDENKFIELIRPDYENLEVDVEPRLIIFDVPSSSKDDKHLEKLRNYLGNRLMLMVNET